MCNIFGARAARLQLTNDISQPRGLVVANMNYLGKPTQGKGFAVVTLTKPKSERDLARVAVLVSGADRSDCGAPVDQLERRRAVREGALDDGCALGSGADDLVGMIWTALSLSTSRNARKDAKERTGARNTTSQHKLKIR